jgi:ABC-type phosphate transport system substrate-binding protein
LILIALSSVVLAGEVQTIVNQSVEKQTFTKLELRRIFSRKQVFWSDGQPIVVYVLPSKNKLHQRFSKETLKIFPYQLDRIWNKLTYSGIGTGPVLVESEQALLDSVKSTPGAIGYFEGTIQGGDVHVVNIKE